MSVSINFPPFSPCPPEYRPSLPSSSPLILPAIPSVQNSFALCDEPIHPGLPSTPGSWSSITSPVTASSQWSSSDYASSNYDSPPNSLSSPESTTSSAGGRQKRQKSPPPLVHPYARLEAKKTQQELGVKRRKVWDHMLEKRIFSAQELSSIKAQDRRKIYISSLEALVDSLHSQMLSYALYPVPFEQLEKLSGLHSKTAMAMIAGVLQDTHEMRLKLLELERSTQNIHIRLGDQIPPQKPATPCYPTLKSLGVDSGTCIARRCSSDLSPC